MSEIERYDCEEDRSCEYEVKAVMRVDPEGYYVRHRDHIVYLNEMRMDRDVERLRADTAEGALKIAGEDLALMLKDLDATEQRIAVMVALLAEHQFEWEPHDSHNHRPGGYYCVECQELKGSCEADCKLAAALNPKPEAGSHADKPKVGSVVVVHSGIKAVVKAHHKDGLIVGAGDGHLVSEWSKP